MSSRPFSGYLHKEGGSSLVPKWQKRWFSLEATSVSYAKQPNDVPLGNIYIEDVVAVMDLSGDKRIQQKNAFKITCINRDYLLSAESPEDKSTWMTLLKEACLKREQILPASFASPYTEGETRHVVTVEQFLIKGIRVNGKVPISLLALLARGVSPEQKRVDEKGWFADVYLPSSTLINTFISYGFEPLSLFQSEAISSLDPFSSPTPVNLFIFVRAQQSRQREFSVSSPAGVSTSEPKASASKPSKPALPGAMRLPTMEAVNLKQVQAPPKPALPAELPPKPKKPSLPETLSSASSGNPAKSPPPPRSHLETTAAAPPTLPQSSSSSSTGAAAVTDKRASLLTIQLTDIIDEELEQLMREFELSANLL